MRTTSLTVVLAALSCVQGVHSVTSNERDLSNSYPHSVKRVQLGSKENLRAMVARDDTPTAVKEDLGKSLFSRAATSAFPGSPQFQGATERWNVYKAPTFAESITVSSEND